VIVFKLAGVGKLCWRHSVARHALLPPEQSLVAEAVLRPPAGQFIVLICMVSYLLITVLLQLNFRKVNGLLICKRP
jgi:hypothetical protein